MSRPMVTLALSLLLGILAWVVIGHVGLFVVRTFEALGQALG